jgi:hypothetical protein
MNISAGACESDRHTLANALAATRYESGFTAQRKITLRIETLYHLKHSVWVRPD